jgi:Na+-driven multidrug efflux pump
VLNILRSLAFVAVCVFILGIVLGYGETGVWFGIVLGNILGTTVAYLYARMYISRIQAYDNGTAKTLT